MFLVGTVCVGVYCSKLQDNNGCTLNGNKNDRNVGFSFIIIGMTRPVLCAC